MLGIDAAVVQAVLADWRTAPVDDRLRAALGYREKLTLNPELLDSRDIAQMRAAGLSDQAIYAAAYVCFLFSIIDRLADAFEFAIPEAELVAGNGRFLNRYGYTTNKFMP